eukprot:Hpha_TRINITY_DN15643_c1_g6::TRINITY_DN15643_c1_g6_i1::g.101252::m.101252
MGCSFGQDKKDPGDQPPELWRSDEVLWWAHKERLPRGVRIFLRRGRYDGRGLLALPMNEDATQYSGLAPEDVQALLTARGRLRRHESERQRELGESWWRARASSWGGADPRSDAQLMEELAAGGVRVDTMHPADRAVHLERARALQLLSQSGVRDGDPTQLIASERERLVMQLGEEGEHSLQSQQHPQSQSQPRHSHPARSHPSPQVQQSESHPRSEPVSQPLSQPQRPARLTHLKAPPTMGEVWVIRSPEVRVEADGSVREVPELLPEVRVEADGSVREVQEEEVYAEVGSVREAEAGPQGRSSSPERIGSPRSVRFSEPAPSSHGLDSPVVEVAASVGATWTPERAVEVESEDMVERVERVERVEASTSPLPTQSPLRASPAAAAAAAIAEATITAPPPASDPAPLLTSTSPHRDPSSSRRPLAPRAVSSSYPPESDMAPVAYAPRGSSASFPSPSVPSVHRASHTPQPHHVSLPPLPRVRGAVVFGGADLTEWDRLGKEDKGRFLKAVRADVCRNLVPLGVTPDDVCAVQVFPDQRTVQFDVIADGHSEWAVAGELRRRLRSGSFDASATQAAHSGLFGGGRLHVDGAATRDARKVRQRRSSAGGTPVGQNWNSPSP